MSRLDVTFAALADPTRRAILAQLTQQERTAGELAQPFDISLPAISRHLRVLQDAALITAEQRGKYRVHRLNGPAFMEAAQWLDAYRGFWSDGLDWLEAHLNRKGAATDGTPDHT